MKAATRRRSDQGAAGTPVLPAAEVSWAGAVATVTVTDELGSARAAELAGELARVAASRPQQLVLDLHGALLVNLPDARLMTIMREAVARRCVLGHADAGKTGGAPGGWPGDGGRAGSARRPRADQLAGTRQPPAAGG